MSAQTSLLHLLSWYHLSYLTNKGASTIKHHQPSNTKMNTTATIPEIKISTFIYPKLPKKMVINQVSHFYPHFKEKIIHSSNNFGFPTASPPWIHADLGSAGTWCNIIRNPVIVRQGGNLGWLLEVDHLQPTSWRRSWHDAQPRMTLVLVRKRLSKMIGMYNMCIQPYSFPWYWSFKYLSKWLILYWIYIDRGTPPPSPTSLSIASWRRNTSWCFTNPLRLEQNPSKLGSVPLQPKKVVKQKLSVSQLPLNVLCGEILLVWNLYLKKKTS